MAEQGMSLGQAIAQHIVAQAGLHAVRIDPDANLQPLRLVELMLQARKEQGKQVVVFTTESGSYYRMALGGKTAQPAISKWRSDSKRWSGWRVCTMDQPGMYGLNTSSWKTTPVTGWTFESTKWLPLQDEEVAK